jgi:hypothetical protein
MQADSIPEERPGKTLVTPSKRSEIGAELSYIICLLLSYRNDTSININSTYYSDDYESAHYAAEA